MAARVNDAFISSTGDRFYIKLISNRKSAFSTVNYLFEILLNMKKIVEVKYDFALEYIAQILQRENETHIIANYYL